MSDCKSKSKIGSLSKTNFAYFDNNSVSNKSDELPSLLKTKIDLLMVSKTKLNDSLPAC